MSNIIEGMNVLEQTPIKEYTTLSNILSVLGIFIAIMSIMSIMILIFKTMDKEKIDIKSIIFKRFLFFYVFGMVIALFSVIRFSWFYIETGRYTYKCELEDYVSANYISDNFNVVSVEDRIWTIKDK